MRQRCWTSSLTDQVLDEVAGDLSSPHLIVQAVRLMSSETAEHRKAKAVSSSVSWTFACPVEL